MAQFSVMARTLSHLGDQLISNSAVAILELIKNSYDAKSKKVTITINQRKKTMLIEDQGHGMSMSDIKEKYLVVGTDARLVEKRTVVRSDVLNKLPLGEKGLGRFATMKLGSKLVLVTKKIDSNRSVLLINWDRFSYDQHLRIEDIKVHLFEETVTQPENNSYTKIKLYHLRDFCDQSIWDKRKFELFYTSQFMKYLNPFRPHLGFQIKLRIIPHQGQLYEYSPGSISTKLLEQAHYKLKGSIIQEKVNSEFYVRLDDGREFTGDINEFIPEMEGKFSDLESNYGPIKFEFYFFNRRGDRLKEIKGFEKLSEVRKLLDQFNGGVMIYRDNFRVLPYAEPGNDWLDMDKDTQFRSEGIRFNTLQTVGAIFIMSDTNSMLIDQTNREGLIQNSAYNNLYHSLRGILLLFKNQISMITPPKKRNKGPLTADEIFRTVEPFEDSLSELEGVLLNITKFREGQLNKNVGVMTGSVLKLREELSSLKNAVIELEKKALEVENQQKMVLDLAGVGLSAEVIAHEMESFLARINYDLRDILRQFPQHKNLFSITMSNIKTLAAYVSRLDAQSVTRRRAKARVDLVAIVRDLSKSKMNGWKQSGDEIDINILSEDDHCFIKANQGMVVQVFDNLLNNSHFWLKSHKKAIQSHRPEVKIEINKLGIVVFSDNGRGIPPLDSTAIFEPFFSRRPAGRGLGLYITSEILNFHSADINLDQEHVNKFGNYYIFIIDFSRSFSLTVEE